MKLTVMKPTEIEADAIRCILPVNYEEEDMPNNFPFRKHDVWDVIIDIATGKIKDWPTGKTAELHMKVTDGGTYKLLNGNKVLATRKDYVPSCIPGSYGDYIDFKIDGEGRVEGWADCCNEDRVDSAFFYPN